MALSEDDLEDFITAYENAFGERLTVAQANELFLRLLHLYRSIRHASEEGSSQNPEGEIG